MIRRCPHLPALLVLALSALLGTTGIAQTVRTSEVPIKLDAPPAMKGLRVAVLPVVNGTAELDADKIMEDVLRERFAEVDRAKAVFLMPGDVERVLTNGDALDRALSVTDMWSRSGKLDSTAVDGLDSLLVADAVLLVKISEWETKRVHNVGAGQSSTTIGFHFAMYGLRDKKKLWTKEIREQRSAREMDLTNSSVGYDETGRIQTPNANEPPRAQEVASDLVREAFKKFPNK
jgi:hypothetical protein